MINLVITPLFYLALLGLLLIFIMALLSPLETLNWWAGWSHETAKEIDLTPRPDQPLARKATHYAVYLTAIGGVSAKDISSRERHFLNDLQDQLPHLALIHDVFPFSVTNNPLNGERQLSWLWQKIHNSRMKKSGLILSGLIFVRNLLQVAVSGDPQYGPMYNVGVVKEIGESLLRQGYVPGSGLPISVMGWSGGGQIAIGTARYLHEAFEAPIYVISIGGVMADDPGILYVEHLYHLNGTKDKFPKVGEILYPGRWPFLKYTAWNQAKRNGKMSVIVPGPMVHTGRHDYFDHKATLPNGQSYLDKTVEVISGIISDIDNPE
ncbi:MAG: hypothetical protein HF973_18830 [Chloroflexi bacterium]|nr:hypothetical protein [Chloroflexota bacterium]